MHVCEEWSTTTTINGACKREIEYNPKQAFISNLVLEIIKYLCCYLSWAYKTKNYIIFNN